MSLSTAIKVGVELRSVEKALTKMTTILGPAQISAHFRRIIGDEHETSKCSFSDRWKGIGQVVISECNRRNYKRRFVQGRILSCQLVPIYSHL